MAAGFRPCSPGLILAALAAGLGLPSAAALAAADSSPAPLFAPKNTVAVPPPAAVATPPQAAPPPEVPEARLPESSWSEPVITLGDQPESSWSEPIITLGARPDAPAAKAPAANFAPPPEVRMDAQGNKTLVIHGNQAPQVILDEPGGGQVQVLIGDDTAGLVMDSQGRKTLVVRGGPESPRGGPPPGSQAETRTTATGRPTPATPPQSREDGRYWLPDNTASSRPYWEVDKPEASRPYWEVDKSEATRPYFEVVEAPKSSGKYWEPEPEVVVIGPEDVQLADPGPIQVAALPLAAPIDPNQGITIEYFRYEDERGVVHVSNVPNDPRYQLFTTVVTLQRGLSAAGPRVRFTHETLRPIIMRASAIYNLDPALIAAVIKSESAFDSRAVSWAGAQGLMQLMPKTARDMGVLDSFDPEQNVMGGSRYLRKMLDQFGGDLTLAVAAYNCGPTRVAKVWRVPNIAETQNYVQIVLRNYDRYRLMF